MAKKRMGQQTVRLEQPPIIIATASIAGPMEGEGPLKAYYDNIMDDELWGEKSWEKAESKMMREILALVLKHANKTPADIQYILAGDLLNQCIAANFGLRESNIPFFGVYGACSTMAESLSLGSMLVDGGFADHVVCLTSSHFCSAEKQFRFPLELGGQRPPTSQWTITGSGGAILASQGNGPVITHVTTGKIVDLGIKDANNMGAAMAPAAADTIFQHFEDTGKIPSDYDLIVTGDLGSVGSTICKEMLADQGMRVDDVYNDCGLMVFNHQKQDVHAGGSGCGCSAITLNGYIYKEIMSGNLNHVLFVATGALLSPTSTQQGESIPGIAHAVTIERQVS